MRRWGAFAVRWRSSRGQLWGTRAEGGWSGVQGAEGDTQLLLSSLPEIYGKQTYGEKIHFLRITHLPETSKRNQQKPTQDNHGEKNRFIVRIRGNLLEITSGNKAGLHRKLKMIRPFLSTFPSLPLSIPVTPLHLLLLRPHCVSSLLFSLRISLVPMSMDCFNCVHMPAPKSTGLFPVVKSLDSGARIPAEILNLLFPSVSLWSSHLTSLFLHYFTAKWKWWGYLHSLGWGEEELY